MLDCYFKWFSSTICHPCETKNWRHVKAVVSIEWIFFYCVMLWWYIFYGHESEFWFIFKLSSNLLGIKFEFVLNNIKYYSTQTFYFYCTLLITEIKNGFGRRLDVYEIFLGIKYNNNNNFVSLPKQSIGRQQIKTFNMNIKRYLCILFVIFFGIKIIF